MLIGFLFGIAATLVVDGVLYHYRYRIISVRDRVRKAVAALRGK